MTVTFEKPMYLRTPLDGLEFSFSFIVKDNDVEKREKIFVEVSSSLAANLGFEIWQEQTYYTELIRILYPTIKNIILEGFQDGLSWSDKIILNNNNCDSEKLLSNPKVETVEGKTFTV